MNMFKKISLLLVACVLIGTLNSFTVLADYPFFYQRYVADPSGLEYNGRLYLYGSHDIYSEGAGYKMHAITCI